MVIIIYWSNSEKHQCQNEHYHEPFTIQVPKFSGFVPTLFCHLSRNSRTFENEISYTKDWKINQVIYQKIQQLQPGSKLSTCHVPNADKNYNELKK